jgi:hypothetical protein
MGRRTVEERSSMKMEMLTMGNGMKERSMGSVAILTAKKMASSKASGERESIVGRRQVNNHFHFNFFDFNNL